MTSKQQPICSKSLKDMEPKVKMNRKLLSGSNQTQIESSLVQTQTHHSEIIIKNEYPDHNSSHQINVSPILRIEKSRSTETETETKNINAIDKTPEILISDKLQHCSNCGEACPPFEIKTELYISKNEGTNEVISMQDVVGFVFGFNIKEGRNLSDNDCGLCHHCAELLVQLYNLQNQFRDRSKDKTLFQCLFQAKSQNYSSTLNPQPLLFTNIVVIPQITNPTFPVSENICTTATISSISSKIQYDSDTELSGASPPKKNKNYHSSKVKSICPQCGKEFNTRIKDVLEKHIKFFHENIAPFTCKICGRPFQRKSNLESHQFTHLGKEEKDGKVKPHVLENSHLCSECGMTFKCNGSLISHLKRHTNPIRYQCNECESNYCDATSLRRHVQLMHIDKDYFPVKCNNCDGRFKLASQLREHILFCEKKKRPHRCCYCEKRFKLKQHLEFHLVRVHHLSQENAREMVYPGLPGKKEK